MGVLTPDVAAGAQPAAAVEVLDRLTERVLRAVSIICAAWLSTWRLCRLEFRVMSAWRTTSCAARFPHPQPRRHRPARRVETADAPADPRPERATKDLGANGHLREVTARRDDVSGGGEVLAAHDLPLFARGAEVDVVGSVAGVDHGGRSLRGRTVPPLGRENAGQQLGVARHDPALAVENAATGSSSAPAAPAISPPRQAPVGPAVCG